MKIHNQLILPLFQQIEEGYANLFAELSGLESDEAAELKLQLQKKSRQLELAKVALSYAETDPFGRDETALRNQPRQLKLELRFAQRRLKRHHVSRERTRKNKERISHVSTAAA